MKAHHCFRLVSTAISGSMLVPLCLLIGDLEAIWSITMALGRISKHAFAGYLGLWDNIAIGRIICIIESMVWHLIYQRGAISLSLLLAQSLASTPWALLDSVCYRTLKWVWRAVLNTSRCGLNKGAWTVLNGSLSEATVKAVLSRTIFIKLIRSDLLIGFIAQKCEGIRLAWNCWG